MNDTELQKRQTAQRDAQNRANANYNDFAGELRNPVQIPLPPENLKPLTLSALTVSAAASTGTLIGNIGGKSAASVLSIFPSEPRFAIAGTALNKGATAITAGTRNVTIRETLEGALNSPRDTTFTITVTA